MMKIVHTLWNLSVGGIQTMLVDIVNEQVKTNEVSIIVIDKGMDDSILRSIDPKVAVYCCNRIPGSKSILPFIKYNIALLKKRADIVHIQMGGLAKYTFTKSFLVHTVHNAIRPSDDYRYFKKIFCISKIVKKVTDKQGYTNSIVIYNGVRPELINNQSKHKLNVDGKIHLIQIGRLHKMKGQDLAIKAFNILVNDRGHKNLCIDFIGEGPLRKEMEELICKYNLNDNVHLLGLKPKKYFYPRLCEYDLYIQPSISEGFGLTIAEAMCAKIPVLISDLEGPMEIIGHGKYGHFFKSQNVDSLVDQLELFIKNGENSKILEQSYVFCCENFNITNTANQYTEEYRKLLS